MTQDIFKDIAGQCIAKYYPDFASDIDNIWKVFSDSNIDLSTVGSRPGGGFGFSGEEDPEYNEMLTHAAIFFIANQQLANMASVGEKEASERTKKACELLSISPQIQRRVSDTVELFFSKEFKHYVSEPTYTVWYKDTNPSGKLISDKEKEGILEVKDQHSLVILREDTITQFFINGNRIKSPIGKPAFKILSYVLQNKGTGGTSFNIAKRFWDVGEQDKFRDLLDCASALKQQVERSRAEARATVLLDSLKGDVESFRSPVRKYISEINSNLLRELNIELTAKRSKMDEYEFSKPINYCLIEKIKEKE